MRDWVYYEDDVRFGTGTQMIAEIRSLRSRISDLEKALEPFAAWMNDLDVEFSDHGDDVIAGGISTAFVRFGDIRRARAVLSQGERTELQSAQEVVRVRAIWDCATAVEEVYKTTILGDATHVHMLDLYMKALHGLLEAQRQGDRTELQRGEDSVETIVSTDGVREDGRCGHPVSEWRPIQTAPKNRCTFLVTDWDPADPDGEWPGTIELVGGPFLDDGRIMNLNSGNYTRANTWKWWMPVPAEPRQGRLKRDDGSEMCTVCGMELFGPYVTVPKDELPERDGDRPAVRESRTAGLGELIDRLQAEFDRNQKHGQNPYATVKQEDIGLAIDALRSVHAMSQGDRTAPDPAEVVEAVEAAIASIESRPAMRGPFFVNEMKMPPYEYQKQDFGGGCISYASPERQGDRTVPVPAENAVEPDLIAENFPNPLEAPGTHPTALLSPEG